MATKCNKIDKAYVKAVYVMHNHVWHSHRITNYNFGFTQETRIEASEGKERCGERLTEYLLELLGGVYALKQTTREGAN